MFIIIKIWLQKKILKERFNTLKEMCDFCLNEIRKDCFKNEVGVFEEYNVYCLNITFNVI